MGFFFLSVSAVSKSERNPPVLSDTAALGLTAVHQASLHQEGLGKALGQLKLAKWQTHDFRKEKWKSPDGNEAEITGHSVLSFKINEVQEVTTS